MGTITLKFEHWKNVFKLVSALKVYLVHYNTWCNGIVIPCNESITNKGKNVTWPTQIEKRGKILFWNLWMPWVFGSWWRGSDLVYPLFNFHHSFSLNTNQVWLLMEKRIGISTWLLTLAILMWKKRPMTINCKGKWTHGHKFQAQ